MTRRPSSANPIGGQNCLIKLRDGETPEGLKFQGAPGSIKFALGENPKHSNFGGRGASARYPATRMGVEETIRGAFAEARDYKAAWDVYNKRSGAGVVVTAVLITARWVGSWS